MARVYFKKNQPTQSLHGCYAGVIYRETATNNTSGFFKPSIDLPDDATAEQRAEYRRRVIIDNCERTAQLQMEDSQQAMKERRAIRMRLLRLYAKLNDDNLEESEVENKIMEAYQLKHKKS